MTASSSTASGHSTELRKLITLRGAWEFLLLQPIAVPFFISNGLTTSEIFWLQSVYFITLCLSDIPSGLMGVRFGERRILLAACIVKGIGGMLLCLPSKSLIFIAYATIGVANALYLAVESTLVFSNLPTHRARLQVVEKVQSLSQGIIFAAILLSGLAGSVVAQKYGLRVLIFANALFAWLSLGLSASLKKTEPRASTTADAGHYKDVLRLLTLPSNVTPLVLIVFGFTVAAAVPIYIQNRLVDEKVQLLSFGLVFIFRNYSAPGPTAEPLNQSEVEPESPERLG